MDSEQSATDSNELIDQSDDSSSAQAVVNQRRVMFNTSQSSKGKGHRLGDGSANTNEPMDMDVGGDKDEEDEEDMDQDDDDDDDANDNNMNVNMFPLRGFGQPRPGRPHPLARGANRGEGGVCMYLYQCMYRLCAMVAIFSSHKFTFLCDKLAQCGHITANK